MKHFASFVGITALVALGCGSSDPGFDHGSDAGTGGTSGAAGSSEGPGGSSSSGSSGSSVGGSSTGGSATGGTSAGTTPEGGSAGDAPTGGTSSGTAGNGGVAGASEGPGGGGQGGAGASGVGGDAGMAGDAPAGTSGQAGNSGQSGTSGVAGAAGNSGGSGASGMAGTSGNPGPGGNSGVSGSAGASGAAGTAGNSGNAGTAGAGNAGNAGSAGVSGSAGAAATSGSAGTMGGNECLTDDDCTLHRDCCSCTALGPGDPTPPTCNTSCIKDRCEVDGVPLDQQASCRFGQCIVGFNCNSGFGLGGDPPNCGDGHAPVITSGSLPGQDSYGECVDATQCADVKSCDTCGNGQVCIGEKTGNGFNNTTTHCVTTPASCNGEVFPDCGCLGSLCGGLATVCDDSDTDQDAVCKCAQCQ